MADDLNFNALKNQYENQYLNGDNSDKALYWGQRGWMPANGNMRRQAEWTPQDTAKWGKGYGKFDTLHPDGTVTQEVEPVGGSWLTDHGYLFPLAVIGAGLSGIGGAPSAATTGAESAVDAVGSSAAESLGEDSLTDLLSQQGWEGGFEGLPDPSTLSASDFSEFAPIDASPVDGIDQLSNEWNKFVGQSAQPPGTILNTDLPTIDLSSAASSTSPFVDKLKSLATPSNLSKVASLLKGGGGGGTGGMNSYLGGGTSLVPNTISNNTPGMVQIQGPQQQQQLAQALILGNGDQPRFSQVEFSPLYKLAQALQNQE